MSSRFLLIRTDEDSVFVSEFRKLGFPEKYFQKAIRQGKIVNVWHTVSETHPQSGEAVLVRTRTMLNPQKIVAITEVEPTAQRVGPEDYIPTHFAPKPLIEKGRLGLWTAPDTEGSLVVDAVPGAKYPIRRDEQELRRYVVLKAGVGEDEVRFWLDEPQPAFSTGREDSTFDEDDDDDFQDEDEG